MLRRKPVLTFVLAATLLLALTPPSTALAIHGSSSRDQGSLWSQIWQWLTVAFPGLDGGQRHSWSHEGPAVDPDGKTTTFSTPSALRAVWGEEGGFVDPNGKPTSTSTTSGNS